MIVTVLCPGPSLSLLTAWPDTKTIGVNRAPLIVRKLGRVDWWVYAEARIPQTYPLDYSPAIFTTQGTRDLLGNPLALAWESQSEPYDHKTGWRCFSATAALVLAAELGATDVNVYGADMTGTLDADGHGYDFGNGKTAARFRNPERWSSERVIWRQTCEMLAAKGVNVNRIQPTESMNPCQ